MFKSSSLLGRSCVWVRMYVQTFCDSCVILAPESYYVINLCHGYFQTVYVWHVILCLILTNLNKFDLQRNCSTLCKGLRIMWIFLPGDKIGLWISKVLVFKPLTYGPETAVLRCQTSYEDCAKYEFFTVSDIVRELCQIWAHWC